MLEKLLAIKSVKKMLSQFSYEYWLDILEEDFADDSDDFFMLTRNQTVPDEYTKYMVTTGYKGNNYMKFIKIFVDNQQRMTKHFHETGNNAAISFINTVPYAFKEMLKVCSRVIDSPESKECTVIRNMTLGKSNFIDYDDATLLLKLSAEDDSIVDDNNARVFWEMIETLIDAVPTEEICDVFNRAETATEKDDAPEETMKEFIGALCVSCPDLCNGTDLADMFEMRQARATPLTDTIYTVGLWISVFFLAATLFVFFLVPHLRRSIHGKCTIFHLVSMIVAYSSLAMAQYIHMSAGVYCLLNGFALQFSFLAMFFWLNVMCFDILLAFSFLKKKQIKNGGSNFKMTMYSLYAWGVPCIVLAVSLAMEYGPWLPTASSSRPGIGDPKCFFKNLRARWLYLYGPIAVIIVSNVVMFTITAIMIFKHSRSSSILRNRDSQAANKNDNARLLVYLNLFIIMGANWLGEVLAWNWPNLWIFYVTDITTALQGVVVFFLFVCKKRILSSLNSTLTTRFRSMRSNDTTMETVSNELKSITSPNDSNSSTNKLKSDTKT